VRRFAGIDVVLEEQGLRDGLQSERDVVPTEVKLELLDGLLGAGLRRLQVCSFVHPARVPQMADAEALCAALATRARSGVIFSGLVLNDKGVERAIEAGLSHVAASISASDTHSRKNTGMSLQQARESYVAMVRRAKGAGLSVRGGIQCAFGCRDEGPIAVDTIIALAERHLELGVDEIALADSTGMGDPGLVSEIAGRVLEKAGGRPVFLHLHDTEGLALANAFAALEIGVRHFDVGFGGTGGCPFIAGASGNVATEDLARMLHALGATTGVDVAKVSAVSAKLERRLDRRLPGRIHRLIDAGRLQVPS
jgi:hydroxymethylglutaryl-CoA lyase